MTDSTETTAEVDETPTKPAKVRIRWPKTNRTQEVSRAAFDRTYAADGWIIVVEPTPTETEPTPTPTRKAPAKKAGGK